MESLPVEIINEIRKYLPIQDYYRSREISRVFNLLATDIENQERYQDLTERQLAIMGNIPGLKFIGIQNKEFILRVAAANGHLPLVRYLVEELDVSIEEKTLCGAARRSQLQILEYLLTKAQYLIGYKAYDVAVIHGNIKVLRLLNERLGIRPKVEHLLYAATYSVSLVSYFLDYWLFSSVDILESIKHAVINNQLYIVEYILNRTNLQIQKRHLEAANKPETLEALLKLKTILL